ncbi:MAG: hypothetical protein IJY42_01500, partial [Clostridia bacterium]|nr:hypothetical protein [Clostridia bacterium]
YGAGIGSGYNTHCKSHGDVSRTTIQITGTADNTITAVGGTYAAGIGTGYHVADLAGEIKGDLTINATSGTKLYKDTYTLAQDIGFGVVDPAREAKDNDSFIVYKGVTIAIPTVPTRVSADNIGSIDFAQENKEFVLSGEFADAIAIEKVGNGSTLTFDHVTAPSVTLNGKVTLVGDNTLSCGLTAYGTKETPVELTISNANVVLGGSLNARITDGIQEGKAVLTIENSTVQCSTIFVGGHTNNQRLVETEFYVRNSVIDCNQYNGSNAGSVIAVWGQDAVTAEVTDSEIYTYNKGWHGSEDNNGNAITFQGGGTINVDIVRSNMHMYGPRSIVYARSYGGTATVDFNMEDSFLWVVTKSNHQDTTLPIWGVEESDIVDSVLIFVKGAYKTDTVVSSWVYGNPELNGTYAVIEQAGWDASLALGDGQTVTVQADADFSVYDGAGVVNFVLTGSASVIVEEGASLTNIGVVAADGYTLVTNTVNGDTVYTVTQ